MGTLLQTALVPIADGTEEIEAVCIIDTLRRADIIVTVASVSTLQVTASRKVGLVADTTIDTCVDKTYDLIALPGGMPGAENLANCPPLIRLLKEQKKAHRLIGAICAAPAVVLKAHKLLEDQKATCYPAFQDRLDHDQLSQDAVVCDDIFITGQGPGMAIEFALALVEKLKGKVTRDSVAKAMLV